MSNVVIKCMDCNKPFTLTSSHAKWFLDKGLELPKRCKECRTRRRNEREKEENHNDRDPKAV